MVNNQKVQVVKHAKLLGVTISSSLKWNMHIEDIIKNANNGCIAWYNWNEKRFQKKKSYNFTVRILGPY